MRTNFFELESEKVIRVIRPDLGKLVEIIFLVLLHDVLQFIKPVIPHFAEWLNKIRYFFHFFRVNVIVHLPAGLFLFQ